ncbi:hypothetical protein HYW83_03130 [Candidatus Peregrinibacteria bacterium]|nr:hypothetical protein [Candidatus Peregrinibacteria bacterium]
MKSEDQIAIHKPSRKQALLFFFISILLAAGVIAWTFFLNKGKLVAEGPAPFRMNAGGKQIVCEKSPCIIELAPRSYDITLQKDGYYDASQRVAVARWKETKIAAQFEFIPKVYDRGDIVLPFETAPLKSPFIDMKKFENFPKDVKEALFSASGNFAMLKLGRERYIYDVQNRAVSKIDVPLNAQLAWIGEKIASLETNEENEEKQILFISDTAGKRQSNASFARPLKNPAMFGSPLGQKIIIRDGGTNAFYEIDVEKQSRKKIEELTADAVVSRWVGKYIIFSEEEKIFALDADTFEKIELGAADAENITEIKPGVLVFLSLNKRDSGKANLNQTLEEAVEAAKKETLSEKSAEKSVEKTPEKSLFITEFTIENRTLRTLAEIPLKPDEIIHRLTFDANSGNLFFIKNEKLYEVQLKAN